MAVSAAVAVASLTQPGAGLDLSHVTREAPVAHERLTAAQMLLEMVPANPFKSLVEGNMLQIIVFALLCGMGLSALGAQGAGMVGVVDGCNDMLLKVVGYVMLFAPVGVFCLVARTFATTGFTAKAGLQYMTGDITVYVLGLGY